MHPQSKKRFSKKTIKKKPSTTKKTVSNEERMIERIVREIPITTYPIESYDPEPVKKERDDFRKTTEGSRWFQAFVRGIVVFLVIVVFATGGFLVLYFSGGGSDVSFEVLGPKEVDRGTPFEIEVIIANETATVLKEAELAIHTSKNLVYLSDLPAGSGRVVDVLGDLGSESIIKRLYRFVAVGDIDASEEALFALTYLSGRKNGFETERSHEVKIKESPIAFTVTVPDQILSGSVFDMDIQYENTSGMVFSELVVEAKYPTTFVFRSSSLEPDSLNNYWELGEFRENSNGNLVIEGVITGKEGDRFVIPIKASTKILGKDYLVAETEIELVIAPSPLSLQTFVNRSTSYVARVGDELTYTIRYDNSSGIALADVVLEAELSGELFDLTTLVTSGTYDTRTRTVRWNASHIPAFRLLDPGASGEVSFVVRLKNEYPIERLGDKNFTLRLDVVMSSPSVPYYLSAPRTEALASLETKVSGKMVVDAKAFYRDAASGIPNLGSMPPKINEPTEYTIHWLLTNYSTDVSLVSIRASLPQGVEWTGIVKSNIDSIPLYEEATREVVWSLESIRATKGILDAPLEAVFQVRATPIASYVGLFQPLLNETTVQGTDMFTNLTLTASDVALNTSLPDDVTIGQNGGRVTQ